jgi:hypothetical protein
VLSAFNLTTWGYQDIIVDKSDGSYGGMLTKLLFRTLPDYYPSGSAYAHFPFLVPTYIKAHMTTLPFHNSYAGNYVWSRPSIPKGLVTLNAYDDVHRVVTETAKYISNYDKKIATLMKHSTTDRSLVGKASYSRLCHVDNIHLCPAR